MKQLFACGLTTMPLRESPSEAAECGTMLLYGERYRLINTLNSSNGSIWHHVLCEHDSYAGYISDAYHLLSTQNIQSQFRTAFKFEDSTLTNGVLSPGSLIDTKNSYTIVPDDPREFLLQYLKTPYLWGGRAITGIDCSGLSQVFMQVYGVNIPRNASEQAEFGELIPYGQHKIGDLAFLSAFGSKNPERVTHVGIILNNEEIIHSSGCVRIDRFEKSGIIRSVDSIQTHELISIKRFIS